MNQGEEKRFGADNELENTDEKFNQHQSKRIRSENWNDVDKELLKDLIKKRVKEIENKNTDTNTNQTKKRAWNDIEKNFNSLCSSKKRTIGQMKSQWTTIKMNAKKEVAEFRAKSKQTGGGQAPPEVAMSGNDIAVWLPNEFVIDSNEFDSDVVHSKGEEVSFGNSTAIDVTISDGEETFINASTKKQEDAIIQLPKNLAICKKKDRSSKNNVADESIIKMTNKDLEYRQELHLLQVEAETKRIRNLDLEFEVLQAKLKFYKQNTFDHTGV